MKLHGNKIFSFMLAAAFALTLAGCGGGGGSATMTEPEPPVVEPEPTPQEMCEGDGGRYNADGSCTSAEDLAAEMAEAAALSGAQEAAMAAYMMAMGYAGSAKDPVAMGNAQMYAGMAKEASDAAAAATTSAMAMEYQMKAEMYRDMAMEAGMTRGLEITKLANKIINQSDIDNAVLEGKTGDAVPKPNSNLKARVGAALDLTAAAANERSETPATTDTPPLTAVPMGSSHQGTATSVRATYGASGPSFTIAGGPGAVDKGETPTSLMTAGEKPTGGWPGAEYVGGSGAAGASRTYTIVFTDINAPAVKNTYDTTPSYDATALDGHVTNKPEITGDVPNDGSSFDAMYNFNPSDNAPPVAGKFSCSATLASGCAISVRDGVVESIEGYVFQRLVAAGTTMTPDADYLAWGVWLTVPNDVPDLPSSPNLATAGAFASGNDPFEVRPALKGTATYNGDATGLYSAGGMVEYFDADVSLMANFGGTEGADSTPDTGTVGDNDELRLGLVTGSVTNIRAGGMDVEGSLTLKNAFIDRGATADAGSTGGFMGTVSGTLAGRTMAGNWGGQFYGPNDSDKPDAAPKAAETEFPTTAAGTFGASAPGNLNDPVRILGAFGAWKAE